MMNLFKTVLVSLAFFGALFTSFTARAGITDAAAKATAKQLMRTFGKELAGESVESLAQQVTRLSARYGDDAVAALRKVGPSAVRQAEQAGISPAVFKLMARQGDDALWIVARPRSLAIFHKFGDPAAEALVKHRLVAENLIIRFDQPALGALNAVNIQNARRLAILANDGLLPASTHAAPALGVIARYGDPAMDFLWRHRAVLAGGAALTAFLANPEPYLNGTIQLADLASQPMSGVAMEATRQIAGPLGWVLSAVVAALLLPLVWRRSFGRWAHASRLQPCESEVTPATVSKPFSPSVS